MTHSKPTILRACSTDLSVTKISQFLEDYLFGTVFAINIEKVPFPPVSFLKTCVLRVIGGTEGLFANKTLEITDDVLASYKNQGWGHLLSPN